MSSGFADALYGGAGNDTLTGQNYDGFGPVIYGGAGNDIIRDADGAAYGGSGNDTLIGGDRQHHGYDAAALYGESGDDLILGGGGESRNDPDQVYGDQCYGGAGNDRLMGAYLSGGQGLDGFYFRASKLDWYGDFRDEAHTFVRDFEVGERILLNRAQVVSGEYDANGYAVLRRATLSDISLGRSGDDLVLTGPAFRDPYNYTVSSTMTIEGFFRKGLTSIIIDGKNIALIEGTNGGDSLVGTAGVDSISLYGGNDRGFGQGGDDRLYGGDGNDTLNGGEGDDSLWGGAGNDRHIGGVGDDVLSGGDGNDTLGGGEGNDTLDDGSGDDVLWGGAGNDSLGSTGGHDRLYADDGDDTLYLSGEGGGLDATAYGGTGDDELRQIYGLVTLFGDDGDDTIVSSNGTGAIFGGTGGDRLYVDNFYSFVRVYGDDGNDIIDGANIGHGGAGNDTLIGGDWLYHGYDSGVLYGDSGDDLILGGGGDEAHGGAGNDRLTGGQLWGGEGTDSFYFRGVMDGRYGGPAFTAAHVAVRDFEAAESILLDRARIPSGAYDSNGYAILRGATSSDISLSRSGNDLILSGPAMRDTYGDTVRPTMTIESFFSKGLTSINIDGANVSVIGI